jgi:hypothetical protein
MPPILMMQLRLPLLIFQLVLLGLLPLTRLQSLLAGLLAALLSLGMRALVSG